MRALITGVAGQDGTLLSAALLDAGWDIYGSRLDSETLGTRHSLLERNVLVLDVTDSVAVAGVISQIKPQVIFHFAGITSVALSIQEPELTRAVNVGGTLNILNAMANNGLDAHLIHAASTEIFDTESGNITENSKIKPRSPYGESKAEAYLLCQEYRSQGIRATNAILANHESYLRSTDFVTGKIANGVAQIKAGLSSTLKLGNLDVSKDWSSATDIVRGLKLIAELKFVGDVILASGKSTSLITILEAAFTYVGISDWQKYVISDSDLMRPNESKSVRVDPSFAFQELGWQATSQVHTWVGEMVQFHLDQITN